MSVLNVKKNIKKLYINLLINIHKLEFKIIIFYQ